MQIMFPDENITICLLSKRETDYHVKQGDVGSDGTGLALAVNTRASTYQYDEKREPATDVFMQQTSSWVLQPSPPLARIIGCTSLEIGASVSFIRRRIQVIGSGAVM